VLDYPMVTDTTGAGAYKVLSSSLLIANESATQRSQATPITYNLKITQDGKLTFAYSYNGGTWQPVITSTPITGSNGAIPANVRFGFAGSDGGASNIHEILCFAAAPVETSGSSGGVNVYQNPTIRSGTQIFLANYFPSNWTGQLTAQTISYDATNKTIVANTTPNWDARCVLSGPDPVTGKCATTGQTTPSAQDTLGADTGGRQILTWDSVNATGIALEQASLTTAMKNVIDAGDSSQTADRVNFLRGDRTNEIPNGTKAFRTRQAVLGDIVDSSPTWVGPPQVYSSDAWTDQLYTGATMPENGGQKYSGFVSTYKSRPNVVYVGANDGFLHGFRAGSLDSKGNLDTSSGAVANDGKELIAYMPGVVFQAIHSTGTPEIDYAGTGYSHAWYVDGTPGTGDLFYKSSTGANSDSTQGTWHTWIVGGLGAGGAAIYALDVTDPSSYGESTAATTVIGEWTPSNITCVQTTTSATTACGPWMGNTYGTPLIRRFHNGSWGVIFGNGYGSSQGKAGIYIMLIDPATAAKTFYYLPTSSSATGNGIGPTTSSDIDLDHVTDYIYAGDLKGNLWRFDVTDKDPTKWVVSANSPLFTTPTGQPITTAVTVSSRRTISTRFSVTGKVIDNSPVRMIVNFATGQQTPQTLSSAAQFAQATQSLYGVWDWDLSGWNTLSGNQKAIIPGTGVTAPKPITQSNLVQQTMTSGTSGGLNYRTVSKNAICWPNSNAPVAPNNPANPASCTSANQYGWYVNLTSSNSLYEQAIFDTSLSPDGVFIVNTYIPASNSPLNCSPQTPTGFSMGLEPDSGNPTPTGGYFFLPGGLQVDGLQLNGIGMPSFIHDGVSSDTNAEYMLTQSGNGLATPTKVATNGVVAGQRLNWIQRR
jgi:type IV pilus assembly protein PilY1